MGRLRKILTWLRSLYGITTIAVILIISIQWYQRVISGQYDPYHCQALLHNGTWSPSTSGGSRKWEPKGCRMVEYSRGALHDCLDDKKVVFVGDSTIRQIFWAGVRRLDPKQAKNEIKGVLASERKHEDMVFEAHGLMLEFIWDPWLNSTALSNILEAFHPSPGLPGEITVREKWGSSAALIIIGAPGLWAARYGGYHYLDLFKRGIASIMPHISNSIDGDNGLSSLSWNSQGAVGVGNQVLLAPVQVPEYSNLAPNRSRTITPKRIEEMNEYLSQLPTNQSSHIPWVYNQLLVGLGEDQEADGLHVSDGVAAYKLDIALNARCNSAARARSPSFRGTCCIVEPANGQRFLALGSFGIIMLAWSISQLMMLHPKPLLRYDLITKIGWICLFTLAWSWFCDRTHYIGKAERHYQQYEFVKHCIFWIGASLATLVRTRVPAGETPITAAVFQRDAPGYRGPGFLSRDHSDEIKGVMQGFILLYHYHAASQTLWVYKLVRLFISAYFYISGYGHTMYLLKTRDFSLARVAATRTMSGSGAMLRRGCRLGLKGSGGACSSGFCSRLRLSGLRRWRMVLLRLLLDACRGRGLGCW
ncbi:GDSL/SGNH-like acyl-esterase family found in Pmr5 and Cas1p-domain-containing protein [Hypoxylon crocopeplum]|nr:GDSL/SGNH-like acyl-esterase family found in Pmr5 and Cas1p-domain-containing protein [Hypoxylon crocopeplum]